MSRRRIAVVHDWLDTWGGAENVLAEILRAYPEADLYALVDFLPDSLRQRLSGKRARTTFIQRIPGARRHFRKFLPLFPRAIESIDLSDYDIVVSSSHAVAKGVRSPPEQLHICYCHTPMRYAWDLRAAYLGPLGLEQGWRGALINAILDRLREWDRRASDRVSVFVANSQCVRDRIARAYGRDATVIEPPVDTEFFRPPDHGSPPRSHYFTASRWVPYKRIDVIVQAFRGLPDRKLVVAGAGPEAVRIRAAAGPNVEFAGHVTREEMRALLRAARAFVFAADEDFGILPVEAQACGTPVIAYGRGGALETVLGIGSPAPTGVFFDSQTPEAIGAAIERFESLPTPIDPAHCRAQAERFAAPRFATRFTALVDDAERRHERGGR